MTKRGQQKTSRAPRLIDSMRVTRLCSIGSPRRSPKRPPRASKGRPRDPKEDQKGAQETSKTLPRPSWRIKRRYFKNEWRSQLKSRFLRFGGSSWGSKIDPKRPQERIKNSFEEHNTRRGKKKGNEDDRQEAIWAVNMLWHRLFQQQGLYNKRVAWAVWSAQAPRQPHARGLINDKNNNVQPLIDRTWQFWLSNTL